MELTAEEREAVERHLAEPVPLDRFEAGARELRALVPSGAERQALLERAEMLVRADAEMDADEIRHLEGLRAVLQADDEAAAGDEAAPGGALLGRARAALGGFGRRLRLDGAALATSLRTLAGEAIGAASDRPEGPAAEARERRIVAALLAARVARSSGGGEAETETRARQVLRALGVNDDAEVEALLAAMRHSPARTGDRQHLCAAFNRVAPEEERARLLSALFATARPDAAGGAGEETELRLIANYLWIEPQEFHRIRRAAAGEAA